MSRCPRQNRVVIGSPAFAGDDRAGDRAPEAGHWWPASNAAGPWSLPAKAAGVMLAMVLATAGPAVEIFDPAHRDAAYGRWGFDESGIDPAVSPGDSFFDFANGA